MLADQVDAPRRPRAHAANLAAALGLGLAGLLAGGALALAGPVATTTSTASTAATTTAAAGPLPTAPPKVSGALRVGERLVADPGTWTGQGTLAYRYQWYRCNADGGRCSSVHGATGSGYRTVGADLGKSIGLTVQATDSTGTRAAYASLLGPLAAAGAAVHVTGQPQVSGEAFVGRTLSVSQGTWQGGTPALTYAWGRCNANGRACGPIAGATSSTYVVRSEDVGHAIVAAVTAKVGQTTLATLSTSTAAVTLPPGPRAAKQPAVGGTAQVGKRLTATDGAWTGEGAVSFAYQWYRCDAGIAHCSSIHGATAKTYLLVGRDAGRTIALTVKATDATGTTSAYASAVGPIAAASAAAASSQQPALTGAAVVGTPLQAPAGAASYAWLRCNANGRACIAIAGAASAAYTPVPADVGHVLVTLVRTSVGAALSAGAGPVASA